MNMNDKKWQLRFMDLALQVATWSKDPRCQVGALVVSSNGKRVSWGYNGFPRVVEDDSELLKDGEWKNTLMIHAEHNALINSSGSVEGWTLVTTRFPCHECAKVILQYDIKRVIAPNWHIKNPPSKWDDSQELASDLFANNVEVILLELHDTYDVTGADG